MWQMSPLVRQILASVYIGLTIACMMATLAYPAVAVPQWSLSDSPIHFTPDEASWFATVPLLICIPGSFVGGMLCEWLGPRRLLLLLSPLLCAAFMLMRAAVWEVVMQAGLAEVLLLSCRVVQGIVVAVLNPTVYMYTYEMTDARIRGAMTGLTDFWTTFGYLLCYLFGCFFSWEVIAWLVPLLTVVPSFIGLLFTPESPMWLVRKGKEQEALTTLMKFRCSTEEVIEEVKAATKTSNKDVSFVRSLQEVMKKPNLLGMVASALLLVMKEMSGNSGIIIYIVYIFQVAGVGLDPSWSSVVVGSVRFLFNGLCAFLVYNVPRRIALASGTILSATAATSLGIFFFLQNIGYDVSHLGWVPLVSLIFYIIGYAGAQGPFCWLTSVEVLPGPVRSIGCGTTNAVYSSVAFLISKTFPDMQASVGLHGVFWFYASSSVLILIIVLVFIPETYGMSLKDVERYWENVSASKKEKEKCDFANVDEPVRVDVVKY
ncbi:facilitated trehalose transporter Tret1-like [Penaeus monodon]|uniref:facilitated trehalose transporter Tret1-like n=1 Tax=Penaeus monodon TaxID=6687 RepID=UPI0018A71D0D|nr:facilitated trehalose transporter Tret1-like [Penaeus monodon]